MRERRQGLELECPTIGQYDRSHLPTTKAPASSRFSKGGGMFGFATAYAGDGGKCRRYGCPSVQAAREPEDVIMAYCGEAGLARVFNGLGQ